MAKVSPRRIALLAVTLGVLGLGPTVYMRWRGSDFPSDQTPEGAYLRVVIAVREDRIQDAFAYLETEAQWACHTIAEYRKKSYDLVAASYPEPERTRLLEQHQRAAQAADAADYFAREARARGWVRRLRQDMSAVGAVEVQGERATVETARGTRYPFRRRDNGIWGTTLFTAELRAEAVSAARDHEVIERAARDYKAAR